MKVAVVTMWGERYNAIAEITVPVMKEYCAYHDYKFWEFKIQNDNNYNYRKHEYFIHLFNTGHDLIFYLDVDALITNHKIKPTDFIDSQHDLYVTKDPNGVNLGSLILKSTDGGRLVNDFILSKRNEFVVEQDVVSHYIDLPKYRKYAKVLSHPSINSYPYSYYPEYKDMKHEDGNWELGDFVCHVPGLAVEKRIQILKNLCHSLALS